jgi:putative membrane protein
VLARVLLAAYLAVLVWSAIRPHDYFTWFMEVFPALIGIVIVIAIQRRAGITPLLLALLTVHAAILMVGGHYTYAEVPLGSWMQQWFGWARNDYDRIGHFAQGFVPALAAREIFIRRGVVRSRAWRFAIIVLVCLGISAAYELLEWTTALAMGTRADDFLGTQGDPWDTQEDMATALAGAITALVLLPRVHDRQIDSLSAPR